jgi:hypothetical protein
MRVSRSTGNTKKLKIDRTFDRIGAAVELLKAGELCNRVWEG